MIIYCTVPIKQSSRSKITYSSINNHFCISPIYKDHPEHLFHQSYVLINQIYPLKLPFISIWSP
jgi:hypothetical protein